MKKATRKKQEKKKRKEGQTDLETRLTKLHGQGFKGPLNTDFKS